MIRMGGVDAFMLNMETPSAYMHTFKVAILDPSTDPEGWKFDKWRKDFADRLHLVPFFRLKYAAAPLGLNHPMWVDDPDFNLDYHVRRVACPAPGDHRALCDFMSEVYAYQLDRSRPLWMAWVVEGLQDGKVAVVMLVHHAYVDGLGAAAALPYGARLATGQCASLESPSTALLGYPAVVEPARPSRGANEEPAQGCIRSEKEEGHGPTQQGTRQGRASLRVDDATDAHQPEPVSGPQFHLQRYAPGGFQAGEQGV
jgi:WS/DGAT/MGAT family acyltransferase